MFLTHSALAAGAVGLTTLGRSGAAQASSTVPEHALLSPRDGLGPVAAGDGVTDDSLALQDVFNRATEVLSSCSHVEPTIDLEGRTYRFDSPLWIEAAYTASAPKTRLRVRNGTLLSSVGDSAANPYVALHVRPHPHVSDYPEITFENFRIQRLQYQNVTGLLLEGGLRCSFQNCAIESMNQTGKQGFSEGLALQGNQICSFVDCHFSGNHNHLVFEQAPSGGLSTDCRFHDCSFSESQGAAILSRQDPTRSGVTMAQCLFDGCSIETAYGAPLVDLWDTRHVKFHSCRFENDPSWGHDLVRLGKSGRHTESKDARFIDCNFSGVSSTNHCISGAVDVEDSVLMGNVFPSPSGGASPIHLTGGFRAVANTHLADR